jgi:glyoxylase-like metal-dependent hydrolase (beta-lactamase superfamily II)
LEQIRKNIGSGISIPVPETFHPDQYVPFTGTPTGLLEDNELIDLGNRQLAVYHTPGHSPGHICIYDSTNGYLYTGDLLYDTAPVYAFYPSTNPSDLIRSWERIAEIAGVTKVFGSHHTLGLEPSILHEAKGAAAYLRKHGLDRFGTGLNHFKGFSVQF